MDSCIAILHPWTMTKWWQHQSDHSTFSNCLISTCHGLSCFLHRVNSKNERIRARTVYTSELGPFISEHREDHKNQAFRYRYLKQYIILCDLCYVGTFSNFSMLQKRVCSVKTFFLCEHLVCKTRIYFRPEWLVYVMRMHSMWYVQTYSSKRLLH